jgi:hypothetical protein
VAVKWGTCKSYIPINKNNFTLCMSDALIFKKRLKISNSFSVFLRILYPMLPVSLIFFVFCTLCCQFLCFSSHCVLYVASFSVFLRIFSLMFLLSLFYCAFFTLVCCFFFFFLFVYPLLPVSLFFFVLCTLCCQFLSFKQIKLFLYISNE